VKYWNIFFGTVAATITIFMVIPSVFGLQSLTQWGGMYTDGWCSITTLVEPAGPDAPPIAPEYSEEVIQLPTTRIVFSAPMNTVDMCYAWAQSWCGVLRRDGQARVYSARPLYRGEYPFRDLNVCDAPPISPPWYYQE